jgi:hypothetical protein
MAAPGNSTSLYCRAVSNNIMQHYIYLILILFTLSSNCTGQVESLTIDPKINNCKTTEVCTDFQYHHCIDSCYATISFDTLKLTFHKETASTYDDLTILIINDKAFMKYKTVYMALDPGITNWYPIQQNVTLNTNKWSINDQLFGKLDVEFQEIHIDQNGNKFKTRVIGFSGQFTTQIQ